MKNNQPVTSHEVLLRSDCSIISHTNSKGVITEIAREAPEFIHGEVSARFCFDR